MTSEAEAATESEDTLSAKTKKERFEEQSWDSLKSSPTTKFCESTRTSSQTRSLRSFRETREYSTRLISCRDRSIA
ncbi:hypothetical protein PHMEG_00032289 [Phytophthora megakarya]|uniref:Uncharacterized protein n=1 Tax=Phytophthora megakarya TaxID=4795 RepID=A0A225UVY1_9STRA|nr:hypothetical protein PHMEG_00032289 [Phytophthora megakarya]